VFRRGKLIISYRRVHWRILRLADHLAFGLFPYPVIEEVRFYRRRLKGALQLLMNRYG